jgi:hypothetical protein
MMTSQTDIIRAGSEVKLSYQTESLELSVLPSNQSQ